MRFASLGSGSRGNGFLVEADGSRLLIDCGFSASEATRRLARLGCTPADLDGIVVTHEHGDHVRGVVTLARAHGKRVWMTAGTARQGRLGALAEVSQIRFSEPLFVGGLELRAFPVPHDAREPCQLVLSDGSRRLGILLDTGHVTPHIERSLQGCQGLVLECNHDETLLAAGRYPPVLKRRIAGPQGHLSNAQAATLLGRLGGEGLQHVVAAHLSEENNSPDLACAALGEALGCGPDWIEVVDQDAGLHWRHLR